MGPSSLIGKIPILIPWLLQYSFLIMNQTNILALVLVPLALNCASFAKLTAKEVPKAPAPKAALQDPGFSAQILTLSEEKEEPSGLDFAHVVVAFDWRVNRHPRSGVPMTRSRAIAIGAQARESTFINGYEIHKGRCYYFLTKAYQEYLDGSFDKSVRVSFEDDMGFYLDPQRLRETNCTGEFSEA